MYSRAASVIRGHQDRSRARSFCKFSAISSTPSSVTLLHPDSDNTVKWGSECTGNVRTVKCVYIVVISLIALVEKAWPRHRF